MTACVRLPINEPDHGPQARVNSVSDVTSMTETPRDSPSDALSDPAIIDHGNLFVVGGLNVYNETSALVYCYNSVADEWTSRQAMHLDRCDFALCVAKGELYVFGGWNATQGKLTHVEKYTPSSNSWSRLCDMPESLFGHSACTVGEYIYILSGNSTPLQKVYVYDIQKNTWDNGVPMPVARAWASVAAVGHRIFVSGGFDIGKENSHLVYDTVSKQWKTLNPVPIKVSSAGICVADNKLYLFGGARDKKHWREVYVYDTDKDSWQRLTPMPEGIGCRAMATFVNGRDIHLVCGVNGNNINRLHVCYNVSTDTWTHKKMTPEALQGLAGGNTLYS
jgi:N-acetylneuraminic acid mutarotase